MKNVLVLMMVALVVVSSGCATYVGTVTSGWKTQTYDNQMYIARSRHRHQLVEPLKPGQTAAVLKEDPEAEIFNEYGYKDGLTCIFVNDSRHELRLVIDDPHGQKFTFRLPSGRQEHDPSTKSRMTIPGWTEMKLEMGLHRISAFRDGRDTPYVQGEFRVYSDKNYHVEVGQMHYFGGGRFGD